MASATVDGVTLAHEIIGEGRPWVITPGGRFTKDEPGVRELAHTLAAEGNRVLIWDRPNCGESDVCFTGDSESAMQADALAGLLRQLDMARRAKESRLGIEIIDFRIKRADLSVDGGPWHEVFPDDGIADSRLERYSVNLAVTGDGEHTISMRAFDNSSNVGNISVTVRK